MPDRPLHDETIVIRGGLMDFDDLRRAVDLCFDRRGIYGLSLAGEEGWSLERTAHEASIRNTRIRVSTVGRLRELGLEVVRSGRRPHLTLYFGHRPTEEELSLLDFAFDVPILNPSIET